MGSGFLRTKYGRAGRGEVGFTSETFPSETETSKIALRGAATVEAANNYDIRTHRGEDGRSAGGRESIRHLWVVIAFGSTRFVEVVM